MDENIEFFLKKKNPYTIKYRRIIIIYCISEMDLPIVVEEFQGCCCIFFFFFFNTCNVGIVRVCP